MHRELRACVATLRGADLARVPRGGNNTAARLVAGAALHDVYHAGQIFSFYAERQSLWSARTDENGVKIILYGLEGHIFSNLSSAPDGHTKSLYVTDFFP